MFGSSVLGLRGPEKEEFTEVREGPRYERGMLFHETVKSSVRKGRRGCGGRLSVSLGLPPERVLPTTNRL